MNKTGKIALLSAGGLAAVGLGVLGYRRLHVTAPSSTTTTGTASSPSATTTATTSATTSGTSGPGPNSTSSSSATTTGSGGGTSHTGTTTGTGSGTGAGTSTGSATTTGTSSGTTYQGTTSGGSLPDWQALDSGPFSDGNVLRGSYVYTASGAGPVPEALVQEAATFEGQRQATVIAQAKASFTGNRAVPATDNPYIVPSVPSGYVATWATGYGWNIVQAGNTWLAQVPAMIRQMGTGGTGSSPTGATYLEEQELSAQYKAAANFAPETVYLIPGSEAPGGQPEYLLAPSNQPLTSIDVHFTSPQSVYTAQPNAAYGGPGPTILGGGNPGGPWEVLSTAYGTPNGPQDSIPSGYTGLLLSIPTGIQVFAQNGQFVGRTS